MPRPAPLLSSFTMNPRLGEQRNLCRAPQLVSGRAQGLFLHPKLGSSAPSSPSLILNWGCLCPAGDTRQCLGTILVATAVQGVLMVSRHSLPQPGVTSTQRQECRGRTRAVPHATVVPPSRWWSSLAVPEFPGGLLNQSLESCPHSPNLWGPGNLNFS